MWRASLADPKICGVAVEGPARSYTTRITLKAVTPHCAKFDAMADTPESTNTAEFATDMGLEFLGVIDGAITLQLALEQKHMSRADRAHGGVLFTMLDTVLGRAILTELPEGRGCATVEIKVNYFRPVQTGIITARGWKRELTKSLGYAEGEIVNQEGKLLAKASGTFFLTETFRQQDRERI